jgi:oligoendopeptidase F
MRSMIRLLACLLGTGAGWAATPAFVAIPPDQVAGYHLDFARHFFASPAEEVAARRELEDRLRRLEELRGRVARTPGSLLQALSLDEQVRIEARRHGDYLHLRHAVDTRDGQSAKDEADLDASVERRTSFLTAEILALDETTFDRFATELPALQPYRFAVSGLRRSRQHTRPLAEEELLSGLGPVVTGWPSELYDSLLDRTPFGTVRAAEGPLDLKRQRAVIANHSDRAVREAGFKQRYAALATQRDLFAFTLLHQAQAGNELARLHHFADAAEEAYFGRFLTKDQVDLLLRSVAEQANVYKDYQKRRAEAVRARLGIAEVHLWDVQGTATRATPPRYTIAEATTAVRQALSPLGPEFAGALAQLLDPRNGRLDIVGGEHRAGGGFSKGFVGVDSVFFAAGFDGSYNDMRVLTHEGTHAVHRQLMTEGGVSPIYAQGPAYLFESFATFSELLLADSLAMAARDPAERQFFLEQFLEGKGTVMFVAGPEAALEQAVYEGVAAGRMAGADGLDALTRQVFARYSIWTDREPELGAQWMTIPLMYEDPFYDLNYIYASLLALEYYSLYQEDPRGFAIRYAALLRHGFDAPPEQLLQKAFGIGLEPRKLVADAMRVLTAKMAELEAAGR